MAILREEHTGREYPLVSSVLIGRDLACDIRVGAGHASRRHARIFQEAGVFFIEDLGSVNGTHVNGHRIESPTRLHTGDHIEISGLNALFQECPAAHVAPNPEAAASAIGNHKNITSTLDIDASLRVGVAAEAKLKAVLEISRNLSNALQLDSILPRILESLFTVFPQADHGIILILDPWTGQPRSRAVSHRHENSTQGPPISQSVLNRALQTGQAILSDDIGQDDRFDMAQSVRSLDLHSLMCVPMFSQERAAMGIIQVSGQNPRLRFSNEDLDVLVCVATQAGRAIELAQLYEARRDQEATEIQKSFLPSERPRVEGLSFFDHYASAQNVGGDYYDYIPLPGNRLGIVVGDVAGKGVSAALLMARLSAFARFFFAAEPDVVRAFSQLNHAMCQATTIDRFVTFLAAVVDLTSFSVTLVNAGHPPLLRRRGNSVDAIGKENAGFPLGVIDQPYESVSIQIEPGDALILYTDGLTDARNAEREFFGLERLMGLMRQAPLDAEAIGQSILGDIRRFTAGRPQSDDVTLTCVVRRP